MNPNTNSSSCCSPSSSSCCTPASDRAGRNVRVYSPSFQAYSSPLQGYPSPLLAAFFPEFAEGLGFNRAVRTPPASIGVPQAAGVQASQAAATAAEPIVRIAVNISELQDRFEVQASLPGFNLEQVEVTFEDNVLTLKASPNAPAQGGARNLLRQEIPVGSYARSIAFREAINPEAVSATMQAGLLTVTLGKQASPQPRRITINSPGSN